MASRQGSPNKRSAVNYRKAMSTGVLPLDYLLSVMRDESLDPERRDKAANAAAPYLHAKLSSVDVGNKNGQPLVLQLALSDKTLV